MIFSRPVSDQDPISWNFSNYFIMIFWWSLVTIFKFLQINNFKSPFCTLFAPGSCWNWGRIRIQRNLKTGSGSREIWKPDPDQAKYRGRILVRNPEGGHRKLPNVKVLFWRNWLDGCRPNFGHSLQCENSRRKWEIEDLFPDKYRILSEFEKLVQIENCFEFDWCYLLVPVES